MTILILNSEISLAMVFCVLTEQSSIFTDIKLSQSLKKLIFCPESSTNASKLNLYLTSELYCNKYLLIEIKLIKAGCQ